MDGCQSNDCVTILLYLFLWKILKLQKTLTFKIAIQTFLKLQKTSCCLTIVMMHIQCYGVHMLPFNNCIPYSFDRMLKSHHLYSRKKTLRLGTWLSQGRVRVVAKSQIKRKIVARVKLDRVTLPSPVRLARVLWDFAKSHNSGMSPIGPDS